MQTRVLILGLDAATFDLIEPWVQEGRLPHFQCLMKMGVWGRLESTIPPVTAVAWNTFATGKNPGKHGVFDFVRREADGYHIRMVGGGSRKATPFWRLLDRYGIRTGVINMPMTYPPDHLKHGFVISGFDAPGFESDFVHPPYLKEMLKRIGYVISPTKTSRETWAQSLFESFEVQKRAFWELKRSQPWDVLITVFMQLDHAQHLFWREMETKDSQFSDLILRLYQKADALVGSVLDDLDDDTVLIVVSDHGAGPLRKAVSINQWLFHEGYLALKKSGSVRHIWNKALLRGFTFLKMRLPSSVKSFLRKRLAWVRDEAESYLLAGRIDWSRTQAFAMGEYGGIFINLKGRESEGIVPPEDYERLRSEIAEKLSALRDPDTGQLVIHRVFRREEIYNGPYVEQAPDLVLHWDYAYDCRERAGSEHHDIFEEEASYLAFTDYKKTGVHRLQGVLLMYGPPVQPGIVEGARLMDIAPTLLHLLGVPVPDDMDGRVLTEALKPEWLAQHPITYQTVEPDADESQDSIYGEAEEAQVKERLRALGYLD